MTTEKAKHDALLSKLPIGGAAVLLLLGASVTAGWLAGWRRFVDWDAVGVARPGEALLLMVFALALYARATLGRRWSWLAVVPVAAGLWLLLETWGLVPAGFNELWVSRAEPLVAMAPAVAWSMVGAGAAMCLLGLERGGRFRVGLVAGIGSVVAAGGLAAVLGHATGLAAATTLGGTVPVSGPLAVGFLVLGCCLVAGAVSERPLAAGPAWWLPVPLMIGCAGAAAIITVALRDREMREWRRSLEGRATAIGSALRAELEAPVRTLGRCAARAALGGSGAEEIRVLDATMLMRDYPEVERVWRLGADFMPLQAWSAAGEVPAETLAPGEAQARREGLLRLREQPGQAVVTATPDSGAAAVLLLHVPVRMGERAEYLGARVQVRAWIDRVLQRLPAGYREGLSIRVAGHAVHGPEEEDSGAAVGHELAILGVPVVLNISGGPERSLATVVGGAGVVFSLLLGLAVNLAQKAHWREQLAEAAAAQLATEDRERRKAEMRLRVSEERHQLAMQAGQVGTFDWDPTTGEAFFSTGAWELLGYEPSARRPRMSDWDDLIHRDDLAAAKRDFPRGSRLGFREAEYRVRDAQGGWRWILERAKPVAFGKDNTPRRVAGTFQDITPRKQAEEALRVSQAESRKLAVVASTTESLVVITDAGGRIEWVNDSVVRHLGIPRTEVTGRALADLFPVPSGAAAESAVLRESFVRRLPVEVVLETVARGGRRFHLQGDVRPVAGERGEIEKFIAVLHDVSSRIESERTLRLAKQQAEEATKAKSDFLAAMSHEIRTPMNGVIGLARLLLDSPLSVEQRDWVETIRTSGDALMAIINDILDFSKIESGRLELERAPFSPADCVEEALEIFGVAAGQKGLELAYWMGPEVPSRLLGDSLRLRQILVNLVGNAVKFTAEGRVTVEVRAGAEPEQIVFRVADTGIGIPEERLAQLFRPFSQVDASTTRRYGGTGLGLAICKRLVEQMRGEIHVETRLGEGSEFHFSIRAPAVPAEPPAAVFDRPGRRVAVVEDDPVVQRFLVQALEHEGALALCFDSLAAARAGLAEIAMPDLVVVDDSLPDAAGAAAVQVLRALYPGRRLPAVLLVPAGRATARDRAEETGGCLVATKPLRRQVLVERLTQAMRPAAAEPERGAPAAPVREGLLADRIPLRVLLAEDNPVNKKVALRLLERFGYTAEAVVNGLEAVRAVSAGNYDLVFMDVQMPELDGLEATRRIRASLPEDRQPVIIALTANAIAGDSEQCRAAGMDDYVSKPVTPEALQGAILRCFGQGTETSGAESGPS